ncbi:SMI1/KNR4 family protein [Streptomyces albipurpureus]|uniref:SMI1/KNR4 family protein n=1 Tax=Streptomyces albipurpureus TaxID=2897419 RepID=A0ABT0UGR1_9ACTN|nr:SMI1/KNR4 family protein [Streptomyces sp. CWNU-1]MCM2387807.1 SMI1/KNR4 family protein [Streptomyces sp. CWNU-1]
MDPDLVLLRQLIEGSAIISARPGRGLPEPAVRAAESVVGALPGSYRWWLTTYGSGTLHGTEIATIAPEEHRDAPESLLAPGRLMGNRLHFYEEPDGGDSFSFALDQSDQSGHQEYPVLRRDHFTGEEERYAEGFAGFLTVQTALASGLGDGPNPTIARLWRTTPGVLLPNGIHIYGPGSISERNKTYEVRKYAPPWVLVGDDSGGRGLLMRHHGKDRTSVYRLDLGALDESIATSGERVTGDLLGWLNQGAEGPEVCG